MADTKPEIAVEAVHSLDEDIARFVVEEGVRHTVALQTAAHALDARATQVATILFAAAALSAGVIGAELNGTSILAAVATGFFVWGGVVSFRAIKSTDFRAPGIEPAWWIEAKDVSGFSLKDAYGWAAGEQQRMIDHVCSENEKRGNALNASLNCGYAGAVLVALAAVIKLGPAIFAL